MSAWPHDIPAAVSQYLDTIEYVLFRLTLFAFFVFGLWRLIRAERRKR